MFDNNLIHHGTYTYLCAVGETVLLAHRPVGAGLATFSPNGAFDATSVLPHPAPADGAAGITDTT